MKYLIVVCLNLIVSLVGATTKSGVSLASLAGQVDALAAHLIRCRRLPGLTVAVVRAAPEGGRQVLTRSYGFADVATNRTVDVNTRFCLAGITQCFTAATLTQLLHENNSFSLDSTIQSMLGGWFQLSDASRTRRVTVRDILSHRVGLAPYFGGVVLGYNFTRIELIRRLRHIPVTAPFRHSFVPNPLLYVLAGHLVQNLNDTFWENVIMRRLFKPLHMTGSTFADRVPNWAANFALPHVLRDGQPIPISSKITGNILRPVGPSNSICSTAPDMAEWMLTLLRNGTSHGDPVLDPRVIDEMFSAQNTYLPGTSKHVKGSLPVNISTDAYNLGWFSGSYRGHKRVFQNGFANYFGSFVTLFPDDGLGIFTAANGPSLTGMDNAFRALHYSISDLAMGETGWLNESTVCTYPKPWIMAQKKPVKTTINDVKTTKKIIDDGDIKNETSTTPESNDFLQNDSINTDKTEQTDTTDTNEPKTTTISTISTTTTKMATDFDVLLKSTASFELTKVTTQIKTTVRPKVSLRPEELRNETIGNDVTSQSRLRTVSSEKPRPTVVNKSTESADKKAPLSRPLVYVSSTSFRHNRTTAKPNGTKANTRPTLFPSSRTRTDSTTKLLTTRHRSTTKKTTTTTPSTTTKRSTTITTPSIITKRSTTTPSTTTKRTTTTSSTTTKKTTTTSTERPSSFLPVDEFDEIETPFVDGIFGMRLPTDFDGDSEIDTTTTRKPIKTLPVSKQNGPSTSSVGLSVSTKTKNQKTKPFSENERDNTIGRLQQSESVLILSTTPFPRIRPNWHRRNQTRPNTAATPQISALDEMVMKHLTSTTQVSKLTDDFDAFILTDPFDTNKIKTSTAEPKMDPVVSPGYFSDVSTSAKTEPVTRPSKITSILTSGQFPVLEKVNNFKSSQAIGGNNLGFHLPPSFWPTRFALTTTPTLHAPKRQRLLFSSKRRLSGQHRQSRRSTHDYDSVTSPSLIEDDVTETLVKFGVRLARRDRSKREEKPPVSINPFPEHVATYQHPFFGNVVVFFNKTSGTLQMEYGFYGKAHLLPYVQSNTFLLRFFSAVWYVSESDDSRRLPRSVFMVHFKGSSSTGQPERFIVPFFDPRLPPTFVRVKNSSDKK